MGLRVLLTFEIATYLTKPLYYSTRLLDILMIRDIRSLQRDPNRFRAFRIHDNGQRLDRLASPRMAVMRRGVFVGVVYYIDNVFTVQKARMRSGIRQ